MTAEVALVADTQILIWYVIEPSRLSSTAITALEAATSADQPIGVLSFAIVEMVYATEKPSNPFTRADLEAVLAVLDDQASPFEVIPLTSEIAQQVASVPRTNNADPGDRLVVACAEHLGVPVVSSDRKIPAMTTTTVIW